MVAPVAGMGKPMGVLPSPERRHHMEYWATRSRPFLPPHRPNIIKRSSSGHVPRSILSPRRKEKSEKHPEEDRLRLLVRHGIESTRKCETGKLQSRGFHEKL